MYIHFTPKIHCSWKRDIQLLDITLPSLGLTLRNGKEIVMRRPYPNKCYHVATRRKGQRALIGLILKVPDDTRKLQTITKWAVDRHHVIEHMVDYHIEGSHGGIATDEATLWTASDSLPSIWPEKYQHFSPLNIRPCMEIFPELDKVPAPRDEMQNNIIVKREESLTIPLMPASRFSNELCPINRLPLLEDAFTCGELPRKEDIS